MVSFFRQLIRFNGVDFLRSIKIEVLVNEILVKCSITMLRKHYRYRNIESADLDEVYEHVIFVQSVSHHNPKHLAPHKLLIARACPFANECNHFDILSIVILWKCTCQTKGRMLENLLWNVGTDEIQSDFHLFNLLGF